MSEVESLLETDEKNSLMSRRLFDDFHHDLNSSFDELANIFQSFARSFSQNAKDDFDLGLLSEIAQQKGFSDSEVIEILQRGDHIHDDLSVEFFKAACRCYSRRSRGLLFLQAKRFYMYAITDLRRLRVTSAIGQLRVEIESIALMNLIFENSEIAYEWLHIKTEQQGKSFFNKTKKKIAQFRQKYNLDDEWNLASSLFQHPRFVGLIDGFSSSTYSLNNRNIVQYQLSFQDFNPDRPEEFIIRALYVLRTQGKLIESIERSLPEANDPLLREIRIPSFHSKMERLYKLFKRKYPNFTEMQGHNTHLID
jgi:hypothetical protein